MKKILKLLKIENSKDFIFYFIGRLLTKGIGFISIPFFSILLAPEEFGVISIFLAVFSIFSILITLNLPGSIRQYILKYNNFTAKFVYTVFIYISIISLIMLTISLLLKDYLISFIGLSDTLFYLLLIASFLNIPILVFEQFLLGKNFSKIYSNFSIVKTVFDLGISLSLLFLIKDNSDIFRIIGFVLSIFILSCYSINRIWGIIKHDMSVIKPYANFAILFSLPLIFHQLSHIVLALSDRILINKYVGIKETGLYSMAYSLGMVMQIVVISFNSSWLPKFYRFMEDKNYFIISEKLVSSFKDLVLVSILASIVFKFLFPFIISDEYLDSFQIIPTIVASSVFFFIYLIYANISFYANKTSYIAIGSVIAAAVNIVANIIFLNMYGYKIAALTTLFSYFVMAAVHYFISRKILKFTIVSPIKIIPMLFVLLIWLLFDYTTYNLEKSLNLGVNLLISTFILVFYVKKILRK